MTGGAMGGGTGHHLSSYNKKKYVWKLVYVHILGYDVDFGHIQVISLLSSQKYSEKHVGYLAASVLMRNQEELQTLIVNTVRQDLINHNEHTQCLALACVANLGGKELSESLASDVERLVFTSGVSPFAQKKALLTLLRLFRTQPEAISPPS